MGNIQIGRGSMSVTLDDGMDRFVRAALERSAPATLRVLEREGEQLFDDAYARWPVKSGRSRAGLTWGLRLPDANTVEVFLSNSVEYVYYIRTLYPGGQHVWTDLVVKPTRKAARKIAEELAEEIANAIAGGA